MSSVPAFAKLASARRDAPYARTLPVDRALATVRATPRLQIPDSQSCAMCGQRPDPHTRRRSPPP
jgi:hypothetical protein